MKKFLLNSKSFAIAFVIANLFLLSTTASFAATKTWTAAAGVGLNWTTGANWSGGTAPVAGDDIVFNTAGTFTFSTMPATVAYNSITILQGTVNLVGGAPVKTYTLGGNAGTDFTVALGASLSIGANINITLAANATATIAGTFTVGTGRTYNTDGTNVVTTVTGTLANTGAVTCATATKLLLNTGAIYTHSQNGGTIPTATWDAASTCNITGMTAAYPAGTGQTFGNLVFNVNSGSDIEMSGNLNCQGNLSLANSNAGGTLRLTNGGTSRTITVGGNFTHTTGEFRHSNGTGTGNITVTGNFSKSGVGEYVISSSSANSSLTVGGTVTVSAGTLTMSEDVGIGTLNVAGNLSHSAGTITEISTGSGAIIFNGTTAQVYTPGGTLSNTINYTVNNAAGVTLAGSVSLPAALTLTSGILTVNTGSTLTVANGNVIGGAPFSSTKHIATQVNTGTGAQGFLRVNNMAQSVAYLFPVGDGTNYLPATLTPSSATAGNRTFSVCAFPGITTNGTPNGTAFTAEQKARCVDAVWTITYNGAGAPTSAATTVATAWPATLEGANFALVSGALIGVAHYDGPSWGTAVGLGDNTANTATRTNVTTFSPFAVGIVSPGGAPLPIKVYYFNASKGSVANTLNWNAACSSTEATFEIERSADGVNFTTINTIKASQARCALPFSYDDNSAATGTVFYRIKIIDVDGRVNFTSKVKVGGKQNDIQLAGILPNPVSNIAQLNVTTTKKDKVELAIISLEGKVMYRNAVQLQSGSSIVSLDVSGLANGTYFVRGVFADGQTNSIKFIKQ